MTSATRSPHAAVREEASVWIARLDRGLTATHRTELQRWIQQSPEHRAMLLELSALWDRMEILSEMSELFPLEHGLRTRAWGQHLKLAASLGLCVSLLVVASVWFTKAYDMSPFQALRAGLTGQFEAQYATHIGEQRHIQLPDHSVLMLNTNSRVAVHYTSRERFVEMQQGEAHFFVAKNPQRRFAVQAGHDQFIAVGTAFNVRLGGDAHVELTVTEGRVRVIAPDVSETNSAPHPPANTPKPLVVAAGNKWVNGAGSQEVVGLTPGLIETTVAWTRGMIVFDGEPLEKVVAELGRYSTKKFVFGNDIRQIPVSGYFKVGDMDALLTALRENFEIEAEQTPDAIVLTARSR